MKPAKLTDHHLPEHTIRIGIAYFLFHYDSFVCVLEMPVGRFINGSSSAAPPLEPSLSRAPPTRSRLNTIYPFNEIQCDLGESLLLAPLIFFNDILQ